MTCAGTLEVHAFLFRVLQKKDTRVAFSVIRCSSLCVRRPPQRARTNTKETHTKHTHTLSLSLSRARCVKVRNAERRAPSLGDRRRRRRRSREEFVFFVFFDFDTQERHQQFSVEWFSFPGSRFELRDERNGSVDIHRGRDAKNLSRGVLREALASQRGD